MSYTFETLSPADFEDLARDLIAKELRIRFEAFAPGPDGGIDGRHSGNGKSTILQAKHYAGSSFSQLKAVMRKEKGAISKLKPRRYILATSQPLTPKRKAELSKIIGRPIKRTADVFGQSELNALLRKYPEIEKSAIKLWLSSTAVLERIVRSASVAFTAISRADIEATVKIYARNPSFDQARKKLEQTHVLIIAGPPGVGKTTLAEMLAYAYIGEEWDFAAIRSLDDGFSAIVDSRPKIFFFDDFLGRAALDARSLENKDSDLARFIKRIRSSPNARFILTTRANIFEEARKISEHLADQTLDITRYMLNVGIYTRQIKARILYNHLVVARTPTPYLAALMGEGVLPKIVDHKNYSPRIVKSMTENIRLQSIPAETYARSFLDALDNPLQLWDIAFRTQVAPRRHLLFALFFCSEYGVELDELRTVYNALHPLLCQAFGHSHDPKDFEDSVKILEGGFTALRGQRISFVNPSLRDYLISYLGDVSLLLKIIPAAQTVNWAEAVWRYVRTQFQRFSPESQQAIAGSFVVFIGKVLSLPVLRQDPQTPHHYRQYDMSVSERIKLLLEWAGVSGDDRFVDAALSLARDPIDGFSSWRDTKKLIELIADLRSGNDSELSKAGELAENLEGAVLRILDSGGIYPDDLESISDAVDEFQHDLGEPVVAAMHREIDREFGQTMETASGMDSESTLSEHARTLAKLGARAGIPTERIEEAVSSVKSRIAEIERETQEAAAPEIATPTKWPREQFDDAALRGLFLGLMASANA